MEDNSATTPHGHQRVLSASPGCEGEGLEGVRRRSSRVAWASAGQEHPTADEVGVGTGSPALALGFAGKGEGDKAASAVHIILR